MSFGRWFHPSLERALLRPFVHVLFGARQTGKSTLVRALVPSPDLAIDLADPGQRSAYLARPERLIAEANALPARKGGATVVIDEVQAVPALFDAVQHLFDRDKTRFRFVLTGSSARKLRRAGANLLPGRAMFHRLHPLVVPERPAPAESTSRILPLPGPITGGPAFPTSDLTDRLAWGDLPGVVTAHETDREALLSGYAWVYLEEELRREALIKDWATFARFLRLAAAESGGIVNYANIAREAGISAPTVKSHYQLLEDMFVGFHVPAFSGSARKSVLSTPRFFLFDLGVRHAAAGLAPSRDTVLADPGPLLEQWVGIELQRRLSYLGRGQLSYFRTKGGAEVDFIVEIDKRLVPIEVKWTDQPDLHDARHLRDFLADHPRAEHGFVVCRCARPMQLAPNITAIPWSAL
jgi:uncharacterized protein